MNNKAKLILFSILSAIVVIVGVVMVIVTGGYRISTEDNRLEVSYDTVITIAKREDALEKVCEDIFSSRGLSFKSKTNARVLDSNSVGETGDRTIIYTFSQSADIQSLRAASTQIQERVQTEFADADIYVSVHSSDAVTIAEPAWRGAIALAVAAIVAVVYIGIRYGFASGAAGCISALVGGLLSAAIYAIVPIPVAGYAPMLFAGIGCVFTLVFWMLMSAKIKESLKAEAEDAEPSEAMKRAMKGARKYALLLAIPVFAAMLLLGLLATEAARAFFLPALVPLLLSVFAALIYAPCIFTPLKKKSDSSKTNKKYTGKQKADAEQ